jgi:hypothetical protein
MTLATAEFIRRFLIHVLPKGLHRIRHYRLFAKGCRADNIARARELVAAAKPEGRPADATGRKHQRTCINGAIRSPRGEREQHRRHVEYFGWL